MTCPLLAADGWAIGAINQGSEECCMNVKTKVRAGNPPPPKLAANHNVTVKRAR